MSKRVQTIVAACAVSALGLGTSVVQAQTAQRKPPPPSAERPFRFPSHTTTKLDNGLTIFVVEDHRQPVVSATLLLPAAGSSNHAGTKAGLAAMTAGLLRQGTSTRSAQQIAEGIDRLGGSLNAFAGLDSTQASVTVVTSALDTGFELLADIVQRPAFAAEEIDRWRRQTLSGLQVSYTDPEYLRDVVAQRTTYGDHPYAYPTDGFPDTVRALSREELLAFYTQHYTPSGAYLAVAGDIAPDAAAALARKHFGGWKGETQGLPKAPAPPQERRIVVVDKSDAVQTQFGLVGAAVPRNHPDWLALTVANQVLGGGFNSRLNLRLRAKEGLTYGARSAVDSERLAGGWNVTSFTRTEETVKAMTVMLEVVNDFRKNPVTPAELTEATSYLSGVFAIQTETAGAVAGRVLTSALHGLPADYWQTYRDRVRAITAANVADAVQRHLVPDTLSIIAVGNASGFAKGLEPFGTVSIVPLAGLDLTQPDLMAKTETAAGPEAGARGLQLIEAAAAAIGGADAIKTVKDSTTAGDVTLNTPAGEMNGKASATVEQPDKVKIVLSLPMGELVQVSDGTQSWIQVGGQPANALPAPMHAELQRSVVVSGGIGILREALDGRAEVAALESKSVEGTMLDRISWKKGDLEMVVGFDPQTHRIATVSYRGMTMQGPADSELRFSDYQKTENGLMVPMKTTTYQNGQKVGEVVVSEWKFNVGVPAGAFVK